MQLKQGASVVSADGQKVGVVDRVVIEPLTRSVTHLIVRQGFLFIEDKVVPADFIGQSGPDQVRLKVEADTLNDLPPFEETHYILPEVTEEYTPANDVPSVFWYPPVGGGWWGVSYPGGYLGPFPDYVAETEQNIPEGTVALQEGAKVISADDKHVGNIERIFTEPRQNRVTHLLISQGLLLKTQKVVPSGWISGVTEDEVRLVISSRFLDTLPEYQTV